MERLSTKKTCEILGVSPKTWRTWAKEGKSKPLQTEAGQRRSDVTSFLQSASARRKILSARVSSRNQKDDLGGQVRELREREPNHDVFEDFGSALHFKRKGLQALLDGLLSGDVAEAVVAHRDRLCRFGFELLESLAHKHHRRLVVLHHTSLRPHAELTQHVLALANVFSSRLHGVRRDRRALHEDQDLPQAPDGEAVEPL